MPRGIHMFLLPMRRLFIAADGAIFALVVQFSSVEYVAPPFRPGCSAGLGGGSCGATNQRNVQVVTIPILHLLI